MAYATVAAMIARFSSSIYQILNVANGADITANAPLLDAITRANEEVDSYLVAKYALPLAAAPAQIVGYACDMARYFLISATRIEILSQADRDTYRDAQKYLENVASGKVGLTVPGTGTFEADSLSSLVTTASAPPTDSKRSIDQTWFGSY